MKKDDKKGDAERIPMSSNNIEAASPLMLFLRRKGTGEGSSREDFRALIFAQIKSSEPFAGSQEELCAVSATKKKNLNSFYSKKQRFGVNRM